jgi:uncharacterized tellurite resistance protein B-like protein
MAANITIAPTGRRWSGNLGAMLVSFRGTATARVAGEASREGLCQSAGAVANVHLLDRRASGPLPSLVVPAGAAGRNLMGERETAVLRVLTALAWADGIVTPEEVALLDRAAADLGLTPAERTAFVELRDRPVPLDRFEELARELRAVVTSPEAKREVLELARSLVAADHRVEAEEERWIRCLEQVLIAGEAPSLFSRVRLALAGKRCSVGSTPRTPATERERQLLGALLARRVALAAGAASGEAVAGVVMGFLEARGLGSPERGELLSLVDRHVEQEGDRQRTCASINRITDDAGRLDLFRTLFALGAGAGPRRAEAETELRLVANYLWIDPQDYVSVRGGAAGPSAGAAAAGKASPGSAA